jgi:hypothetical protein
MSVIGPGLGCGQYELVQADLGDMLSHLVHSLQVYLQLMIHHRDIGDLRLKFCEDHRPLLVEGEI